MSQKIREGEVGKADRLNEAKRLYCRSILGERLRFPNTLCAQSISCSSAGSQFHWPSGAAATLALRVRGHGSRGRLIFAYWLWLTCQAGPNISARV
jgi:hypothetical protein